MVFSIPSRPPCPFPVNALSPAPYVVSDLLDLVDKALATLSRRLPGNVSREDLASVGKLALIAALPQAQEIADDVRAYCYVRVRGAMLDELRRIDPLSRRDREHLTTVVRVQSELSSRLGRLATSAEIAVVTGLSLAQVVAARASIAQTSDFTDADLDSLPDTEAPTPAETFEVEDLRTSLRDALARLSATQAAVLYRYYFDDATLDTISVERGISKERVRQIREAGEKKLRADFIVLALWQSLITRERP